MNYYNWSDLPKRVFACEGRIVLVSDQYDCGVVLMGGRQPALCLFQGNNIVNRHDNSYQLSDSFPVGRKVQVHSKLENDQNLIPYLATSIWRVKDGDLSHINASLNMKETNPYLKDEYDRLTRKLATEINRDDRDIVLKRRAFNDSATAIRLPDDRETGHERQDYDSRRERDHEDSYRRSGERSDRDYHNRSSYSRDTGSSRQQEWRSHSGNGARDKDDGRERHWSGSYQDGNRYKSEGSSNDRDKQQRSSYDSERQSQERGWPRRSQDREGSRSSVDSSRLPRSRHSSQEDRRSGSRGLGGGGRSAGHDGAQDRYDRQKDRSRNEQTRKDDDRRRDRKRDYDGYDRGHKYEDKRSWARDENRPNSRGYEKDFRRSDSSSHAGRKDERNGKSSNYEDKRGRENQQRNKNAGQSRNDFYSMREAQNHNPWRDQFQAMMGGGGGGGVEEKGSLEESGNTTDRASPMDHDDNRDAISHDDNEDPPSTSDEVAPSNSNKRAHTPLHDDGHDDAYHALKRRKYSSPERENDGPQGIQKYVNVPSHTHWRLALPDEADAKKFHEIASGDDGHGVTVQSWNDNNHSGVLMCASNGHTIVFHINHIIERTQRSLICPARELYSVAEIKARFGVGARLRCFYRKHNVGGGHNYQATVVWRDGPAPRSFRTEAYLVDLDKQAVSIKDNRPVAQNLFSKVRDAVVHEYISYETGLIRLVDDDQCVALFALDQVWARNPSGKSDLLSKLDHTSLHSYLPIGSMVKVTVRSIPHNPYSQLRYQAVVLWKEELGHNIPRQVYSMASTRQGRMDMSMHLDTVHDRIKQNLAMGNPSQRELSYPTLIPVALNLLPKDGSAHIVETQNNSIKHMGLVKVSICQFSDPTRKMEIFVMFHIEDVYDTQGRKMVETTPHVTIQDLKNADVNVICRSISKGETYVDIKGLVDRIRSGDEYKNSKIPLLQAIAVFMKSKEGKIVTGSAALPTFSRIEPSNLNRKQSSTAFYYKIKLRAELDSKVYEYVNRCDNVTRNHMKTFLHTKFFDHKEMDNNRTNVPKIILNRLGGIDVFRDIHYDFGHFNPSAIQTLNSGDLPAKLSSQGACVKLLWFDRPSPKYGLVKIDIEGKGSTYGFFTKKSINTKQFMTEVSDVIWKNKKYTMINAELVDANSKIPYIVTQLWVIGDNRQGFSPPPDILNDWKKVVPVMSTDQFSLNYRAYEEIERRFQDECSKLAQKCIDESKSVASGKTTENSSAQSQNHQKTWKPALKDTICKVERLLGSSYGIAYGYQIILNEQKRYFVLFDLCDVYADKKLVVHTGIKSLKQLNITKGDSVRVNAVLHDTEANSWGLRYIATAAVHGKKEATPASLPAEASALDSSAELKPGKIDNFKAVLGQLMKKFPEPPVDPNPPPPPVVSQTSEASDNSNNKNPSEMRSSSKYSKDRKDSSYNRQNNSSSRYQDNRRNFTAMNMKNTAKRQDIIKNKPELYKELKLMEILRSGLYFYDCKACGIQGMTIDDAEDHVGSEDHKKSKAQREAVLSQQGSNETRRFQDRSDADEALFLNENKSISVEERNGVKYYACADCDAKRMPLASAKKHVMSQAHKKRDKNRIDRAVLDSESRDMRKVTKKGIVYFCQPCAFQTESIIKNKEHIIDPQHKLLTPLFCHVCKMFSHNKNQLSDHRFSISHKKKMLELEEQCRNPIKAKNNTVKEAAKNSDSSEPKSKDKDRKETQKEDKPEDEEEKNKLSCKYCNSSFKDENEKRDHEDTASHIRRVFLATGQMSRSAMDGFSLDGKKGTDVEMILIRKGKDIEEEAAREGTLHASQDIKQRREELINKVFDAGLFIQQEVKTKVKCRTCKTMLSGKEKSMTRQLLMHFLSDKHFNKLKVQIKAEAATGIDRDEAERIQEEEDARLAAEAALNAPLHGDEDTAEGNDNLEPDASASVVVPPPSAEQVPVPDESASIDDIIAYLSKRPDVNSMYGDKLFSCPQCCTGLVPAQQLRAHIVSESHEKGITPEREWRQFVDLDDVYEHGQYFKCLPCNTSLLMQSELEQHLEMGEHMHRSIDENKNQTILNSLPVIAPECSSCKSCFASQLDLSIHERHVHKKEIEFTADQVENLKSLSQSRNLTLKPSIMSARGRVLQVFPDSNLGILQLPQEGNQYINVLFDLSRLKMPKTKRTLAESVRVGYPVLVNCVAMEPNDTAGYSANLYYYASAVTIGDEDEHSLMPVSFHSLRDSIGITAFEDNQKMSRNALGVQLEQCAQGLQTPLLHTFPDALENEAGLVVLKNQSCVLIKILSSGAYAIQILENVLVTESSHDTSSETFEVGQSVVINCLLVDPSLPTQYLVTGCWISFPRESIQREMLTLAIVDMFHTVVKSFCMEPDMFALLDFSNIVIPGDFSGGLGFDDIAVGSDIALAPHGSNDDIGIADDTTTPEEKVPEEPLGFKKIKLGF